MPRAKGIGKSIYLSRLKAVRATLSVTPLTLFSDVQATLSLLHRLILQLPLSVSRYIRLLAMDVHDDDVRLARLPVIGAHLCVPLLIERPAELEEVGL